MTKQIWAEGTKAIYNAKQLMIRGAIVHFSWSEFPTMIGHRPPHVIHVGQQNSTKCILRGIRVHFQFNMFIGNIY